MSTLLRYARTWVWRGVREGSRPWLVAGIAVGVLDLARRAVAKEPELVYQAKLEPGERLEIRTLPPQTAANGEPGS